MIVTQRQGDILNAIVKEYIVSAKPTSSQMLEKKHGFLVCPATIRNEMQKLTELGFLYQPHTSAGRIPTDKGYRFFVDSILEKGISEFKDLVKIQDALMSETADVFRFVSNLSKVLASNSSNLATVHMPDSDFFWKEGWEQILKEPEFTEKDLVSSFAKLVQLFEKEIGEFDINSDIKIFIGRENPFSQDENFTIIATECRFPKRKKGVISLLGPTRMAYERNISLINSLVKILEDF
jgi:heat-inducible transcriptional repressor